MISVRLTGDNTTIACGSRDLGFWIFSSSGGLEVRQ